VVALRLPRRAPRPAASPWPAIVVGLVGTTLYQLAYGMPTTVSPWLVCLTMLVILGAGVFASVRWRLDVFGLAVGAVLTYCWHGLTKAAPLGLWPTVEQSVLVAAVLAVIVLIAVRRRRSVDAVVASGARMSE
jgi:hypothetical protein